MFNGKLTLIWHYVYFEQEINQQVNPRIRNYAHE